MGYPKKHRGRRKIGSKKRRARKKNKRKQNQQHIKHHIYSIMKSEKFVEKIKSYAFVSFIIPLIAINTCFLIYKSLGDLYTISSYPNLNWDKNEHSYTYTKYSNARKNLKEYKFTNCSKYKYNTHFITIDNESIKDTSENAVMIQDLASNNKFKSVVIKTLDEKALNYHCINKLKSSY